MKSIHKPFALRGSVGNRTLFCQGRLLENNIVSKDAYSHMIPNPLLKHALHLKGGFRDSKALINKYIGTRV